MLSLIAFRAAISKLSLRKKLTILISVGVLLPILVLTYLQYRSLTELQNKTKGAFKDNLRQGLTYVEQQMRQRLEDIAAQTLDPIGSMETSATAADFEKYFANVKHAHPEIDAIFVFSYALGEQQKPVTYGYIYSEKFVETVQPRFIPGQSEISVLFTRAR